MSRIQLADGEEIEIDDLADYDQARRLLDQLDREIITIEAQICDGPRPGQAADWLARAKSALRHRKVLRPKLQERIADLKKEKAKAAHAVAEVASQSRRSDKRHAFMKAAVDVLPRGEFNAIMRRAKEMFPAAFSDEAQG